MITGNTKYHVVLIRNTHSLQEIIELVESKSQKYISPEDIIIDTFYEPENGGNSVIQISWSYE